MGTRGLYGFRKNATDKTTYNHFDSYPSGLGSDVLKFIRNHSNAMMNEFYDRIIMVDEQGKPTAEEIERCIANKAVNLSVSNQSYDDWYCLLRNVQGDLEALCQWEFPYMTDCSDFIKDSLFCEYAYIINLDNNMLEFYQGFQSKPQEGNRYGMEESRGYYPCKLVAEIPLARIKDANSVNEIIDEFMQEEDYE